jgi:hypothetical protein
MTVALVRAHDFYVSRNIPQAVGVECRGRVNINLQQP